MRGAIRDAPWAVVSAMMVPDGQELRVERAALAGVRRLRVDVERSWFRLDDRPAVGFERRWLVQRLIVALARARVAAPGQPLAAHALVIAGWPGERILPRAARNRLHVALHQLRRLGLNDALCCAPGGWFLASELELALREPGGATIVAPAIAGSSREIFSW